jgi:hypothetical protein
MRYSWLKALKRKFSHGVGGKTEMDTCGDDVPSPQGSWSVWHPVNIIDIQEGVHMGSSMGHSVFRAISSKSNTHIGYVRCLPLYCFLAVRSWWALESVFTWPVPGTPPAPVYNQDRYFGRRPWVSFAIKAYGKLDQSPYIENLAAREEMMRWLANMEIDAGQYWCTKQKPCGSRIDRHFYAHTLDGAHDLWHMLVAEFIDEWYEYGVVRL